jgi:hypothetical protein
MTEGIADDLDMMHHILNSDEWQNLFAKLSEFVSNYQQKIVPATGGFQV